MSNIGLENFPVGFTYCLEDDCVKIKNIRNADQVDTWVNLISRTSGVVWAPAPLYPKIVEGNKSYTYKKKYKCKSGMKNLTQNRTRRCRAKMVVKLWKQNNKNSATFWPCTVEFQGSHNHVISVSKSNKDTQREDPLIRHTDSLLNKKSSQMEKVEINPLDKDIKHAQQMLEEIFQNLQNELHQNPTAMIPAVSQMAKNFNIVNKDKTRMISCLPRAFTEPLQPVKITPNIPVQQTSVMRVSSMLCRNDKPLVYKNNDDIKPPKRVRFQSPEVQEANQNTLVNRTYII